jgi:hypothetical protein
MYNLYLNKKVLELTNLQSVWKDFSLDFIQCLFIVLLSEHMPFLFWCITTINY